MTEHTGKVIHTFLAGLEQILKLRNGEACKRKDLINKINDSIIDGAINFETFFQYL